MHEAGWGAEQPSGSQYAAAGDPSEQFAEAFVHIIAGDAVGFHGHAPKQAKSVIAAHRALGSISKAGPFIGPRGGKWADPRRTIAWKEPKARKKAAPKKRAKKVEQIASDEEYEARMTAAAERVGLQVHSTSVSHKPGGGAITSFGFNVSLSPKYLRAALGNKPNAGRVQAFVSAAAKEVAAEIGDGLKASEVVEDIEKRAASYGYRADKRIKLLDAAIGEVSALYSRGSDSRTGEVRAAEMLAQFFAKADGPPGSQLPPAALAKLVKLGVSKLPQATIPASEIEVNLSPRGIHDRAVLKWRDGSGRPQSAYTPEFHKRNAAKKWARVMKYRKDFPAIKRKMTRDLKRAEPGTPEHQGLTVAMMIALTGLRPGSHQSLKGRVGIATIQKEHVSVKGNRVSLDFTGKGGKENTAAFTNKAVADALRGYMKGTKKGQRLFARSALPQAREALPEGLHLKDCRTIIGTETAMKVLDRVIKPPPLTGDKRKDKRLLAKAMLQASKAVATKLNNTAAVARTSYVHPDVFREWAIDRCGADPALLDVE